MFTVVVGFKNNKYVPATPIGSLLQYKKKLSHGTVMFTMKSKCLGIYFIFKPQHIGSF